MPVKDRPVLEHLLYACCLENSSSSDANSAYTRLQSLYCDWNEVRVTTVSELTEELSMLNDPGEAAVRIKKGLHNIFETIYKFDLEHLTKQKLSQSMSDLKSWRGFTNYGINYVVQNGLESHSIPINGAAFDALIVLGIATEANKKAHKIPGLERTIAKNQGVEFGALLHQLGVDFINNPYGKKVRELLLSVDKKCEPNLPQKPSAKEESDEPVSKKKTATKKKAAKKKTTKKATAKKTTKKAAAKKSTKKKG
ncbi:MAG TPA: hypothetical protein DCP67_05395 [Planctomycetaceae bacterium]|jgi:endonuclease-3|nr:hypothetical protein [Rhodopirellula sp.]HAL13229.1 hypothetical protein [Planctomycetaceae bacterium]HCK71231.1 hypothetical protein [Planctomycetaceae bacterium]HCP85400.1 hypothetical protein [Planctomycetaceae bacterium]